MASQNMLAFQAALVQTEWPNQNQTLKRRFPEEANEISGQVVAAHSVQQAQKRKENHNATEQRRRQRMNEKINELKELLPHCREQSIDKASILNEAIDLIRKYSTEIEAWRAREHELKKVNEELLHENDTLARAAGLPARKKQMIQEVQEIQESSPEDGKSPEDSK